MYCNITIVILIILLCSFYLLTELQQTAIISLCFVLFPYLLKNKLNKILHIEILQQNLFNFSKQ